MKAIFYSGDPDPLHDQKSVEITTTTGAVDGVPIQGLTIKPQYARPIDLWYNPVTKRWSIGWNEEEERNVFELPIGI